VTGLWSRLFGRREGTPNRRLHAVGEWTIAVPADFKEVDNITSWQAYAGDRVVYVSSLIAQKKGGPNSPAGELYAHGIRALERSSPGDRHRHRAGNVSGEAQVARSDAGWVLTGFMVTDGVLATCLINFSEEGDMEWAVATWSSMEHP
jgi:hypothetical protein